MGFAFANVGAMDAEITVYSFIAVILFVIFFDYVTGILEFFLEEDKQYLKMLELIYKELMLMGVVTFCVIMLEAGTHAIDHAWYVGIDFSHIMLFYVTIFFVVHALYFIKISTMVTQRYREYFAKESKDIFKSLKSVSGSWISDFVFRNYWPGGREIEFLEFRLAAVLFKDIYILPSDFNFPSYLSGCFNRFAFKTINRSLISWLFIFMVVVANYFRILAGAGCGIAHAGGHRRRRLAGDDAAAAPAVADDDHGDDDKMRSIVGVWKNDCAGRDVMEFAITSIALCVGAILLLILSRYYKRKLLCRVGVHSPEDYKEYFEFRETEVKENLDPDTPPTNINVETALLIEAINNERDENEEEEEDEEGFRFLGELLRSAYNRVQDECALCSLSLRTKINKTFFPARAAEEDELREEFSRQCSKREDLIREIVRQAVEEDEQIQELGMCSRVNANDILQRHNQRHSESNSDLHNFRTSRRLSMRSSRNFDANPAPLSPGPIMAAKHAAADDAVEEGKEEEENEGNAEHKHKARKMNLRKNEASDQVVGVLQKSNSMAQVSNVQINVMRAVEKFKKSSTKHINADAGVGAQTQGTKHINADAGVGAQTQGKADSTRGSTAAAAAAVGAGAGAGAGAAADSQYVQLQMTADIDDSKPIVSSTQHGARIDSAHIQQQQPRTSLHPDSRIHSVRHDIAAVKEHLEYTTMSERFLERRGFENNRRAEEERAKCCFGLGRLLFKGSERYGPKEGAGQEAQNASFLRERTHHAGLYNFDDIFLFNSEWLFHLTIETFILMNSLYLSLWLTNFVLVAEWDVNATKEWHVLVQLVMIAPFVIVFPVLGMVAETASMLLAVKDINQEVLYEVLKESMETKELVHELRLKIVAQLRRKYDSTGIIDASPRQLKPLVLRLFDEIDVDRSGFIDKTEFRIFMRKLHVTYSDKRFKLLYRGIDQSNAGGISFEELDSFLFPPDQTVVTQTARVTNSGKQPTDITPTTPAAGALSAPKPDGVSALDCTEA